MKRRTYLLTGSAVALTAGCIGGNDADDGDGDDTDDSGDDTGDDTADDSSADNGPDPADDDDTSTREAIGPVPETAIHQWVFDSRDDETVVDLIGGADGTVHGELENVAGEWQAGYAEYAAPDSGGHIDLGYLDSLISAISDRMITLFATVEPEQIADERPMTILGAGGGESHWFEFRLSNSDGSYAGQPMILLRDSAGQTIRTVADDPVEIDTPTRIVTQVSGDRAEDVAFWIDGERADSTSLSDDEVTGRVEPAQSFGLFASNPQSPDTIGTRRFFSGTIDNVIVCDAPITEGEIADDYDGM